MMPIHNLKARTLTDYNKDLGLEIKVRAKYEIYIRMGLMGCICLLPAHPSAINKSTVCWTQQEDFHWFHWHLDQAQNNTARLCLTDDIHETPRNKLSLLVFGRNDSPTPSRFVKQAAERTPWGRALPLHRPWLGSRRPSSRACQEAAKFDKSWTLQRLYCNRALTYICLVSASAGFFLAPVIALLEFELF